MLLLALSAAPPSRADTFYLSVSGADDGDAGRTLATAWRTFPFAVPRLQPGDTLVVGPGVWTRADGGRLRVDCLAGAQSGTDAGPIAVRALDERATVLAGDGLYTSIDVANCAHWTFEGLTVTVPDADAGTRGVYGAAASDSSNITFRRLLVQGNNRLTGNGVVLAWQSQAVTFEECELYDFSETGMMLYGNDHVARRNYVHSRSRDDLPGGSVSQMPTRGDDAIAAHGSRNLIENNISEGNRGGVVLYTYSSGSQTRFLGNISLGDAYGGLVSANDPPNTQPTDTLFRNHVSVDSLFHALYLRSTRGSRCDRCSLIGGPANGYRADISLGADGGAPTATSVYVDDSLSVFHDAGNGFQVLSQSAWRVRNSNAWANRTDFAPAGAAGFEAPLSLDPQLGGCLVFIPDSSPMKGAGQDGGDIGANVLFRTENGVETAAPLWDPVTGQFPCGRVVPGINDVPDASCRDVHLRLHVGAFGCPLPAGYRALAADGGAGTNPGADGGSEGAPPAVLRVGCGCDGAPGSLASLGLLLAAALRRRR